ncbi:hypothetical protein TR75_09305 [Hydrogenibacillus schlegelii]|nr:hypothetical protein TR75_09305 [Hydrogenibacillus schlegelii]
MKMRMRFMLAHFIFAVMLGVSASGKATGVPRPQSVDPKADVENPAPVFPDNAPLASSGIIPKEKIIETIKGPPEGQVSAELTTWRAYERAEKTGTSHFVGPDRQVWVLKAKMPEFNDFRLGLIRDAEVTFVFDAETGQLLNQKIVGFPDKLPMIARPDR